MAAPRSLALAEQRALTYDDVGDPAGRTAIYLHGTPDSRLARHPDDGLAAAAGFRLLAVDRPGYGGTSPLPPGSGSGTRFAADLRALLDDRGIEQAAIVAWSGGALDALAAGAAAALQGRISTLHLVAGLVPFEAYDDPAVRDAAEARLGLLEMGAGLAPVDLGEAIAPLLAPYPCDKALALDHQREQRDPTEQARLAAVTGAADRMADALVEAVRAGLAGVERDVAAQAQPLGVDLSAVTAPAHLWYGALDHVTPAVFGEWYAAHLPAATLELRPDAGHFLPFTHWQEILASLGP